MSHLVMLESGQIRVVVEEHHLVFLPRGCFLLRILHRFSRRFEVVGHLVERLLPSASLDRREKLSTCESTNFTALVLGCIEAKFCKQILKMGLKALAEIYTMHSFAQLCNLNFLSKKFADV